MSVWGRHSSVDVVTRPRAVEFDSEQKFFSLLLLSVQMAVGSASSHRGHFHQKKSNRGLKLTTYLKVVSKLRLRGAMPLRPHISL
jgi:hypothetical protein